MEQTQQKNAEQVKINSKALVRFESGETLLCIIVQNKPTDPARGIISCDSPLGKALLGKNKGEKVMYAVDNRIFQAEILDICREI